MNIFEPYNIINQTPTSLQLSLSKAREGIYQVTYRAIPVMIILSAWLIMQEMNTSMPVIVNYLLIVLSLGALAFLIFRSYVQELTIQVSQIYITQKTIKGSKYIQISIADVEKINWNKQDANKADLILIAFTKQGKKIELMRIPKRFVQQQNIQSITETIQSITGFTVK